MNSVSDADTFGDTPRLLPLAEDLHEQVRDISRSQIRSRLAGIIRDIFDWLLPSVARRTAEEINRKVKDLTDHVNKMIEALPEGLQDINSLRQAYSEKRAVCELSNKRLKVLLQDIHTLFGTVYPRLKWSPFSKQQRMPRYVEEFLCPEIRQLRMEKGSDPTKKSDPMHRIQRKIAKGRLAVSLGFGFKRNKGTTGTRIVKDINGKTIGVYKLSWKDVSWWLWLKKLIQSVAGGQLTYLSKKPFAQSQAERAAFLLSKYFGFHLAPPCSITNLRGLKGAFQVFLRLDKEQVPASGESFKQYVEAKEVIDRIESKDTYTEAERTKFQKLALFDYLIGNLDRHEENWFVTLSPSDEILTIKAIDNANSFPKKHPPKDAMGAKSQYKWQITKIAQQPFTPELKQFIQENLGSEKVKEFIKVLKTDLPRFLDADMEALLIKRAAVAFVVANRGGETPATLAGCSTTQEMDRLLEKAHAS